MKDIITDDDIQEYVRRAVCRLVRDALELNERQEGFEDPEVLRECEDEILEDAQMIFDYMRLKK